MSQKKHTSRRFAAVVAAGLALALPVTANAKAPADSTRRADAAGDPMIASARPGDQADGFGIRDGVGFTVFIGSLVVGGFVWLRCYRMETSASA